MLLRVFWVVVVVVGLFSVPFIWLYVGFTGVVPIVVGG